MNNEKLDDLFIKTVLDVSKSYEVRFKKMLYLLQIGVDINGWDEDGGTALHRTAVCGDEIMMKKLLDMGARVDEKDKHCNTPLMKCCQSGNLEIVKLLLKKGAKVNAVNLFKSSALKFAVREGNIEIVNELLEKGANPLIKDTLGVNVLDIAKSNGYKDIEALLLKYKGKKYSEIIKRGGR